MLMELKDELVDIHGKHVYFPWIQYRPDELRGQQGYLTKFPAEVLSLFDELQPVRLALAGELEESQAGKRSPATRDAPNGGARRVQDPIVRAAIERRALDVAAEYHAGLGGSDLMELGKPYDIRVTVEGVDRHAEVEGSSVTVDAVELTKNEVHHAHDYAATDLIVVDHIRWTRLKSGAIRTEGGPATCVAGLGAHGRLAHPLSYSHSLPVTTSD